MRNLHIKRNKTFVGCAAKMKVYIEDPTAGNLDINGVCCRKLGDLKNGEEKIFPITEASAKVYVIAGEMSKNYCNDYYEIPEGEYDIYLSGQNRFDPTTGNAFRFDGVASDGVLQNRKNGSRKGAVITVIALVVGLVVGLIISAVTIGVTVFNELKLKPETFSSNGIEITLTNKFNESSFEGFTTCFESMDVAVFALEEKFDLAEGFEDLTVEEYGELVLENNSFDPSIKLQKSNGLTYYEYVSDVDGETYYYFAVIYKEADAFWLVQFATHEDNLYEYEESFIKWACSVKFTA